MANVYISTPITKRSNLTNDAETALKGDLSIVSAETMPNIFIEESSVQLVNSDLPQKEDMADYNFITSTKSKTIQESPKAEPSRVATASQKLKIEPKNQGTAAKGKLHSSSLPNYQNKYSCENCQQSFKNSILLQRHVCPNATKRQRGLFIVTMNNATTGSFNANKGTLNANKSIHNGTKSTLNAKMNDKSLVYKTREAVYTPKKSVIPGTSKKRSPALKVGKEFVCKNCDMKFASLILLNLHIGKMCVAPLKKVPITDSPIPGLHKTITGNSVTVQDLINTQIKKKGFSMEADITDNKTKEKLPVVRKYNELGGIPVASKLSLAFQNMKMQLQFDTDKIKLQ